jgi:hypothetical protein
MILTFPPRPSPPRLKRGRAATDIDGEHSCLFKKKRRLRLFLITSRLSPQFSHPATNIVDRGSSKIAIWAKQKSLGRNLLRKAAILNRIRRQTISLKKKEEDLGEVSVHRDQDQKRLELANLALIYGSHDTHTRPMKDTSEFPPSCAVNTEDPLEISEAAPLIAPSPITPTTVVIDENKNKNLEYRSPNDAYSYSPPVAQLPRRTYLPLPPSPLGLSNYDAFDLEDEYDHYAHFDDEEEDDMADSRSTSANTTDSYTSTLSTVATGTSEAMKSPQQMTFCDFNELDYDEPVMGDYDQVDEGADALWPNPFAEEATPQPFLPASSSPNFLALFSSSPAETVGPFSPTFAAALPEEPMQEQEQWADQMYGSKGIRKKAEDNDMKQERDRQRNFMFLRFNS